MSEVKWISWCCKQAGNDGRRASGIVWQRTRLMHAARDGETKSLCNRPIGCLETTADRGLPRCKVCERRAG